MRTLDAPDQSALARSLRASLEADLGAALPGLRALRLGARLAEVAAFVLLYGAGMALAIWGAVGGGWLVSAGAVACCALAMNAFILFLHEGMHRILFAHPLANR